MITWKNMDTLAAYAQLQAADKVCVSCAMSGENGANRVKNYTVPMGAGMDFNYAARPVDDNILSILEKFAAEQQLAEKFAALYNGDVINTGEKRLVLHHLCRTPAVECNFFYVVFFTELLAKLFDIAVVNDVSLCGV